ncbi:protein germ cell-less [Tribolium castaneum]|uniref:Germ cell-less n=1 Tax=Tribolium castaneum TaxID=7070 RepID=D6WFR4_TRICA|nr:PREDICTED: protein germ cell-less [Tribolium castaneum]EFA01245.1 germ cell-less [Tribolium castaneum]|eukprot:XP_967783.1 PREDICTED: protein germ cell-less [Tribolium castaneum]
MGLIYSSSSIVDNVTNYISGRKRKYSDSEDDEVNKVIDIALHTPKRKKLVSTAQYIYQALFEEGKNSDITVCALGEEFYLHKIYLCQSPYFASMFGGSWLEATKKYIHIDVVDPLITIDSLKVVFGSLYNCEITLNPLQIVSTLATATMFQLDGLIEKCTEVMLETINPKSSLEYYNAACQYGDKKLQDVCFKWFLVNLMTYYFSHPVVNLKSIPIPLMTKLVAHPDLFVMQTEYSIYVLLKYWVYILTHPEMGDETPSSKEVNNFFCSRKNEMPYLLTDEGRKFVPVFQGLRIPNLISHQMDVELVLHDNIIPHSWLNPVVLQQWKQVLRVNQNDDKGPSEVSNELFLETSLRCGRILMVNERHVWRWTGFHFGMDLLMMTDGYTVSVKRNHRSEFEQLLSFQTSRHIAIRVTVVKLNEQRQIVYSKQSEILKLSLAKGEEVQIMALDKDLEYPIIISANILYTSPDSQEINQEEVVQTVS